MEPNDVFAAIADERRQLADLLEGLSPEQWATQSLCEAWTVRGVAGHLLVPLVTGMPKIMVTLVTSGFSFDRAMVRLADDTAAQPTEGLVAALRAHAEHRFTPPGSGPEAPLTDVLVHGQDIRRPLAIERTFDAGRIRLVLGRLAGGMKGFIPRSRVVGLRFEAPDLGWEGGAAGGADVVGPGEAILLALTGRAVALDDLTGDGVEVLRRRLG